MEYLKSDGVPWLAFVRSMLNFSFPKQRAVFLETEFKSRKFVRINVVHLSQCVV